MSLIITSFFTRNGVPVHGLTPTIRIWEVQDTTHTLLLPIFGPDPLMVEVGDGFYKFIFSTSLGYDASKTYTARVDGGITVTNPGERYQSVNVTPDVLPTSTTISPGDIATITNSVVNGVWDANATDHMTVGSMGLYQNEIHADVQQLRIDVTTAISLVSTLLKYERNRTKIDKIAKTLTIYDDDGVTPIKVFDLKDSTGAPSVIEVCERDPV